MALAYNLTDGFTSSGSSDPLSNVPVLSDAEINARLSAAACLEDVSFIKELLAGESESSVAITDDVTMHSVLAKLDVINDVPVVTIVRGDISFASTSLELELLPTKLSPALDASLCGQRPFEFPITLRHDAVDMKQDMGVSYPVILDSATGLMSVSTSLKINKNALQERGRWDRNATTATATANSAAISNAVNTPHSSQEARPPLFRRGLLHHPRVGHGPPHALSPFARVLHHRVRRHDSGF